MTPDHPSEYDDSGLTMRATRIVSDTQESKEYEDNDSYAIFDMLLNQMQPVDFGYHLKRFVHDAACYPGRIEDVSLEDYSETILDAFSNKGIPTSMKPTSRKPRAAVKKWLTQKTAGRETVLLLGFALDMSLDDVNGFLTKVLQESALNPKDPIETICWYCFRNRLGYHQFRKLLSVYDTLPGTPRQAQPIDSMATTALRTQMEDVGDEKTLMRYLNQLRRIDGRSRQSVEAKQIFDRLYDEARSYIADLNNTIEQEKAGIETDRLKDELSRNDRLYEDQKLERIQKSAGQIRHWQPEDITPVNFEEVLFSAVPRDQNGNMIPVKQSVLNEQFRGKRLNRQHIQEILSGTGSISRYDLTTMSFFVLSQREELEANRYKRHQAFLEYTNSILDRCGMGELYIANPYEAFLIMCMLTDYPLGTYADIMELSYFPEDAIE